MSWRARYRLAVSSGSDIEIQRARDGPRRESLAVKGAQQLADEDERGAVPTAHLSVS